MSSEEDINPDGSPDSPAGNPKDNALFEPKPQPKVIRVLTVLAYILSVSMAAILLSIYYIFMWEGHPHIGARQSAEDVEMFNRSGGHPETGPPELARMEMTKERWTDRSPEMQQQMTALPDDKEFTAPTVAPPSSTATPIDETTTLWPDYSDLSSEFEGRSTFIKKLMYNKYPYAEND